MKKCLIVGAMVLAMTASTTVAAEKGQGGFMGGLYGCCFGMRGAAAYNDGLRAPAMEWLNALVFGNIYSAILGYKGRTTEDLRTQFGDNCY